MEQFKPVLFGGFEPVQNLILLVGTVDRNKKKYGSVQNKMIGKLFWLQPLVLTQRDLLLTNRCSSHHLEQELEGPAL